MRKLRVRVPSSSLRISVDMGWNIGHVHGFSGAHCRHAATSCIDVVSCAFVCWCSLDEGNGNAAEFSSPQTPVRLSRTAELLRRRLLGSIPRLVHVGVERPSPEVWLSPGCDTLVLYTCVCTCVYDIFYAFVVRLFV